MIQCPEVAAVTLIYTFMNWGYRKEDLVFESNVSDSRVQPLIFVWVLCEELQMGFDIGSLLEKKMERKPEKALGWKEI